MKLYAKLDRQLLILKFTMFCCFGASASLLPYMTIHMRQLGITVHETSIVYTILPIVQVLGSPIAGLIADKIGNYKPVLLVSLIVSILTSIVLMLIPSSGNPEHHITTESVNYHHLIFGLYLVFRVINQLTVAICFTLLDSTAVFMSEVRNCSFGKIRLWGTLSTGVFPPLAGLLVDYFNEGLDKYSIDYSPTFYFFIVLMSLTTLCTASLDIKVSSSPQNHLSKITLFLSSVSFWALLIVIFVLGSMWGFVESFLFWYLQDLKSPKYLLGLTMTTGALASVPLLHISGWFIANLGHANLMILALAFYFIRFVGYSLIHSPFWCLPYEAMEAFTYHLMWVASATYSTRLASKGLRATVIGVVSTMHNGIGRAMGNVIGDRLISIFDTRLAFRYIGFGGGVTAVLYCLAYYGYLRSHETLLATDNVNDSQKSKDVEDSSPTPDSVEKIEINSLMSVDGGPDQTSAKSEFN